MKNINKKEAGQILVYVAIFGGIAAYIIVGLSSWAIANLRDSRRIVQQELAIQIAEAGNDYYRWHLAHAPLDFKDGTTTPGPYVHKFYDDLGNKVGQFSLTISGPATGSTMVTVVSTGSFGSRPTTTKTITTKLAKPSFAKYAVAANDVMRFGTGTEVFGPIHSNYGIRFDGLAHNVITSAVLSYTDPDHGGGSELGVHTHLNVPPSTGSNDAYRPTEAPTSTPPSRPDVFMAGREIGSPAIDFTGITNDLNHMKTDSQAAGFYRGSSGASGYHIILKVNDTFDLYKVTALVSAPNGCTYSSTNWGTWSIKTQTLLGNYALPNNGLIFLEDHIWVDGQINTARVTIAAATFPDSSATRKSITVNTDLLYTNYNGSDVISLVAQDNINTGLVSDDDLRIDAALVAQNGRVGRFYYPSSCTIGSIDYSSRSKLTLWGMIATSDRYGYAYTDGTGYDIRLINYDASLLYSPPPSFPLVTDSYQTISWQITK